MVLELGATRPPSYQFPFFHAADILVNCTDPGMVASDIQNKTDKTQGIAKFLYFLSGLVTVKTDVGALSALFCATSPDAYAHPGQMWSAGPAVQLARPKVYDHTLRAPTFDAINAAIQSKGGPGFRRIAH